MKIQVENIRTNKFNMEEITVTFNNGATMEVNANTLQTDSTTVVYTEKSALKAERFTKKYKEAFETYLFNCKVDVITHSENERKIEYRVYQVGAKIIAHKVSLLDNRVLMTYDWTCEGDITTIADSYRNPNHTGHYQYSFYVLSFNMQETTAKAVASDIQKNVNFEMTKSDIENLVYTIAKASSENTCLYAFMVDGEKSIHMMFKEYGAKKIIHDNKFIEVQESFKVLSAYNNGQGDRTTYFGTYKGMYDLPFYDKAENVLYNRTNKAKGGYIYRELAF